MKILYSTDTGEVFYAVYDKDLNMFEHTTNISLSELEIDELVNKDLCRDLSITQFKFNIQRQRKYYILNGELYARENWEEFMVK